MDARYATPFIEGLLDLEDVERGSIPLWAAAARHIYRDLTEMGLHDPERYPESRLLMAYCLYWWQSFCKGHGSSRKMVIPELPSELVSEVSFGTFIFLERPMPSKLKSSAIWRGPGCVSRPTIYWTQMIADHLTTCSYPTFEAM